MAFATLPMSVLAAGLGQLNVSSGIGEPLKADIELLSVSPSEKGSLKARIAPQSVYKAQGLFRPASHNGIQVRITKSTKGKNILRLYSSQPMAEPFLDMLVELEWETGRILREYTVLLDPPGYEPDVTAGQIQAPTIQSVDKAAAKSVAPIKKDSGSIKNTVKPNAVKSNTVKQTSAPLEADYLTEKGDTLSKIARKMQPAGVSLDQMLVGLYEANPEAFVGDNMNRLKVGKILQPPTEEALKAITNKDARKAVKVHTADWKQYRNKLAGVVAQSAPEESEVDSQVATGKVTSAEDKSAPKSTGPKDVVKLSAGDAKAQADMEAKIVALQEEVSAREKGLQEAQDRTAALEKQIEDMQKLLTLKSDALAETQKPAEEITPEKAGVIEAKGNEAAKPAVTNEAPAKPVAKPKPVQPKPVAQPKQAPVKETGFVASVLDGLSGILGGLNATLLAAGGGLVALLIGAWLYLRNKRRKNLADFEQGIMTSGGLKANTVFGNTSGASVDTGDTSFLTDFSQSTTGGMIDTNDVDPIAEAEVYMAYGRDAQAEEILKDAISKEPKRYELHLKLLEMYAASKNMSAFETVSGELYTTLGAEDPTWAKVAEIGIKLEPNNPLYQVKAGVGVTEGAEDGATEVADEQTTEASEQPAENADGELDASDFSDSPLASEADLDFSLNDDVAEVAAEAETQPAESLAFEEPTITEESNVDVDASALDLDNVSETLDTQDSALDFDLNTGDVESAAEQVADTVAETPVEDLQFENTMPNLDLPKVDEVSAATDELLTEGAEQIDSTAPEALESAAELASIPNDLNLDLPQAEAEAEAEEVSEVPEESAVTSDAEDDLNFDMASLGDDTITLDTEDSEQATTANGEEAGVLDMTDISLEMDEDVNAAIDEATPEPEPEVDASESEEVETKLELVVAYIDMEDKEGARELLDEVLKEGGTNQRKRAEELLASLG